MKKIAIAKHALSLWNVAVVMVIQEEILCQGGEKPTDNQRAENLHKLFIGYPIVQRL